MPPIQSIHMTKNNLKPHCHWNHEAPLIDSIEEEHSLPSPLNRSLIALIIQINGTAYSFSQSLSFFHQKFTLLAVFQDCYFFLCVTLNHQKLVDIKFTCHWPYKSIYSSTLPFNFFKSPIERYSRRRRNSGCVSPVACYRMSSPTRSLGRTKTVATPHRVCSPARLVY